MRAALVACALLLMAVPAHAAWSQPGGDAAHTGIADLSRAEWDVVEVADLTDARIGSGGIGLVAEAGALYGVEVDGGTCNLTKFYPQRTSLGDPYPCEDGRLIAMTPIGPLGCFDVPAGEAYLVQWSLSGAEAWTIALEAGAAVPALGAWTCGLAAVDTTVIIVPLAGPVQQHRIDWIAPATGEITTTVTVPQTAFVDLNETVADALTPADSLVNQVSDFRPSAVTVTRTGILVLGRFGADQTPAAAMLAMDGTVLGGVQLSPDPTQGTPQTAPMSLYATAQEELAAAVMGDQVLSVDPGAGEFTFITLGSTALGATALAGPAWSRDALVLPTEGGAYTTTSRDAATTQRYEEPDGARLHDLVLAGDEQAFAAGANRHGSHLVRLDVRTGALLHKVPMPILLDDPNALAIRLLPADDALWAWTPDGQAVRFGTRTAAGPGLEVDDVYPNVATPMSIRVGSGDTLSLGWGDGGSEMVEAGVLYTHRYMLAGDHTIRLTRVAADNLTFTTTQVIHVGAESPAGLNFIQNAFSDDNWEITLTVVGFVVSGVTLLFGVVAANRGRRRLERELKALDRISDHGRQDPFIAVKRLHEERLHLRTALHKGKIEESQYAVIVAHAENILMVLRQRILGSFGTSVSVAFGRLVDVALTDGRVGAEEADSLVDAAMRETALAKSERERLAQLVRSWQALA